MRDGFSGERNYRPHYESASWVNPVVTSQHNDFMASASIILGAALAGDKAACRTLTVTVHVARNQMAIL